MAYGIPAGRESKKKEIAEAAVAGFEKSRTLNQARSAVAQQVAKWNEQLGLTVKPAANVGDAMIQAEDPRALSKDETW